MSDSAAAPRSPSAAAIVAILAAFALFLLPVYYAYLRHRPVTMFIPESAAAENLPKEEQWQANSASRLAYLRQLRAGQEKQLGSYAWINQANGVVQLPIDRAMELVIRDHSPKAP